MENIELNQQSSSSTLLETNEKNINNDNINFVQDLSSTVLFQDRQETDLNDEEEFIDEEIEGDGSMKWKSAWKLLTKEFAKTKTKMDIVEEFQDAGAKARAKAKKNSQLKVK